METILLTLATISLYLLATTETHLDDSFHHHSSSLDNCHGWMLQQEARHEHRCMK